MTWRDANGNLCIGVKQEAVEPASEPKPEKPKPNKEAKK